MVVSFVYKKDEDKKDRKGNRNLDKIVNNNNGVGIKDIMVGSSPYWALIGTTLGIGLNELSKGNVGLAMSYLSLALAGTYMYDRHILQERGYNIKGIVRKTWSYIQDYMQDKSKYILNKIR